LYLFLLPKPRLWSKPANLIAAVSQFDPRRPGFDENAGKFNGDMTSITSGSAAAVVQRWKRLIRGDGQLGPVPNPWVAASRDQDAPGAYCLFTD
jgi:hypothetical protein